jgi:DNA-binding NarL/FixJ family response regulator
MKRLAIAEDHRLLRDTLKLLLTNTDCFEVVCEAENGLEAIQCVRKFEPELLLLDLSMPIMGGMSVIPEVKRIYPKTKILVLTMHQFEDYIVEGLQLGADGYCVKDCDRKDLIGAINKVLDGYTYVSPVMAEKVLDNYLRIRTPRKPISWTTLTRREIEVLKLVGEGYRNKQIAEFLFISIKTVEKHRSNIMSKLGIHNIAGLTAYAIEKGLVSHQAKA